MPKKHYDFATETKPYCGRDPKGGRIKVKQTTYEIQQKEDEEEITEALNGKFHTNTIESRL